MPLGRIDTCGVDQHIDSFVLGLNGVSGFDNRLTVAHVDHDGLGVSLHLQQSSLQLGLISRRENHSVSLQGQIFRDRQTHRTRSANHPDNFLQINAPCGISKLFNFGCKVPGPTRGTLRLDQGLGRSQKVFCVLARHVIGKGLLTFVDLVEQHVAIVFIVPHDVKLIATLFMLYGGMGIDVNQSIKELQ